MGNLATPPSIQTLQRALHVKAKGAPGFRFYALYDKVYREDVLRHAYARCQANGGAAGVDGESFEDIENDGVDRWLGALAKEIRERTYRPMPARRVYIPKADGKTLRPLSIPTIRDRTVQTAARLVLEPIFEADLPDEQYGYRPARDAHDAVREVHRLLSSGHRHVVDADLSAYFDTVPHAELLRSIARRVVDGSMLQLLKLWLIAPVEEIDERRRRVRTTRNKDEGRGTPQGSPLSPLLSNIYMRRFILGWKQRGHEQRFGARVVVYADDLVICCKGDAEGAHLALQALMTRLKLTVNAQKTHVRRMPEQSFNFLGYTFCKCYSHETGRAFIGTRPSKASVRRILMDIREKTSKQRTMQTAEDLVMQINRTLIGWANYFRLGPVYGAYRIVDRYTKARLRRWLHAKHKGGRRWTYPQLERELGLVNLPSSRGRFPWAPT